MLKSNNSTTIPFVLTDVLAHITTMRMQETDDMTSRDQQVRARHDTTEIALENWQTPARLI